MNEFAPFYIASFIVERLTEAISLGYDEKNGTSGKHTKIAKRRWRAFAHFAVASVIGVLLILVFRIGKLDLGLLKAINPNIDPTIDLILTGIAIGGGTKPLHDILSYCQKSIDAKGDIKSK